MKPDNTKGIGSNYFYIHYHSQISMSNFLHILMDASTVTNLISKFTLNCSIETVVK